jgi:hypothetical protein
MCNHSEIKNAGPLHHRKFEKHYCDIIHIFYFCFLEFFFLLVHNSLYMAGHINYHFPSPRWVLETLTSPPPLVGHEEILCQALVADACNHSHSRGRDQED